MFAVSFRVNHIIILECVCKFLFSLISVVCKLGTSHPGTTICCHLSISSFMSQFHSDVEKVFMLIELREKMFQQCSKKVEDTFIYVLECRDSVFCQINNWTKKQICTTLLLANISQICKNGGVNLGQRWCTVAICNNHRTL